MKNPNKTPLQGHLTRHPRPNASSGFTLIELLVVLIVIAVLGLLAVPGLAGTKGRSWTAMCRNQMRQLGVGFRLFQQDHSEMFPPAAYGASSGQLSWDSWLNRYIGGNASEADMMSGLVSSGACPKTLKCPADRVQLTAAWADFAQRRSYAMNAVGSNFGIEWQVDSRGQTYPLPTVKHGLGIYWQDGGLPGSGLPDWDAKGYKSSALQDPAGTILLVEEPNRQNLVGNVWPSICWGPQGSGDAYQIDPTVPPQNPSSSTGHNQGASTYRLHGDRFNYLLHDGHVATLSTSQTLGTGTLNVPKGMWTVVAGD
jgi:prepilin-type N-terminal cleavage/methylation domain-containing protein/prepilin-type processing-associated H-X9-DG protein